MQTIQVPYALKLCAFDPVRHYADDAGTDLCCMEDFTVPAFGSACVDTGTSMAVPKGYGGLLVSRSGLNVHFEMTSTGLIDSGYADSIRVRIYNMSDKDYEFKAGDRITQIVFVRIGIPELVKVDRVPGGERGKNGFGSTGR